MDKIKTIASGMARDLTAIAGVASVSYGAWLVYEPIGYIVFGALMLAGYCIPMFAGS